MTERRPIIAVIGMHRSGTSLAMQALGSLGAEAGGALLAGNDYNPRGYWEATEIVAFHDRLLARLDRRWGSPEHMLPLPEDWQARAVAEGWDQEAAELLEARLACVSSGGTLALKDPRMTLFMPLWERAAQWLDQPLLAVHCLRHPAEVAASLSRRDGMSPDFGVALWLNYTAHGLACAETLHLHLLPMQAWHVAPQQTIVELAAFAQLEATSSPPFSAELTQCGTGGNIANPLAARWWDNIGCFPAGTLPDPSGIAATARSHLESVAPMDVLAAEIRAELGKTPARLLTRDLENWRTEAETMRRAYQAEARTSNERAEAIVTLETERDALEIRATELLAAYQAEARTSNERAEAIVTLEIERDALETRAVELLAAYQAKARTAAVRAAEVDRLQARLDRFNPKAWLRPRR